MYVVLQYFWPVPCIPYLHYMVGSNLTVSFISVWIHNSEEYLIIFALTRKKRCFLNLFIIISIMFLAAKNVIQLR